MTNEDTIKLKMQERQHAHEIKLAILEVFAKDPTAKYWAAIGVGSASLLVMELMGMGDKTSKTGGGGTVPTDITVDVVRRTTPKEFWMMTKEQQAQFLMGLDTEEEAAIWNQKMAAYAIDPFAQLDLTVSKMGRDLGEAGQALAGLNPFAWMNTLPEMAASGWIGVNVVALLCHEIFGDSEKGINLARSVIEAAGEAVPF